MVDIQFDKIGLILEGEEKGCYVCVEEDHENTGGYLILTFNTLNPKDKTRIGFDSWVENIEALQSYFQESSWKIKWLDKDSFQKEIGWYYFGQRYYIPELGQFATSDPKGYSEGPNMYAYVFSLSSFL